MQGIAVVCAARRDPGVGQQQAVAPSMILLARPLGMLAYSRRRRQRAAVPRRASQRWPAGGRGFGMALSLIATPPLAVTTPDARIPALPTPHSSRNTSVIVALPSSLSRRVDSLSSPTRWTATKGTTRRGPHTIRSRGVPEVPIQRRREGCLGGMGSPGALETLWQPSPPFPAKEDCTGERSRHASPGHGPG